MTVATGFDVDYYLDQVGADYYLTATGEPPGIWAGQGAETLGLRGQVGGDTASAKTMRALFHYGIGPDGVPLASRQRAPKYPPRAVYAQVEETIARRVAALGRFATPEERREIRLQERAKMRTSTPYYDMTFSAEKSVSLLYAGLLAAAQQARDQGDEREAERLGAEAGRVEAAVMAGADRMLEVAGQRGAIVRTGHHSASSGAFRDAEGLVAVKFLQHTSRADDPQLHVQVTVLNKAQRADGGDNKWRALDGRQLMTSGPRLGFAAQAGAAEAQALARLGLPLVKREDGNGFEIGGVEPETIAAYSSRSAQIEEQLAGLLIEYRQIYGRAPDRAALYKLRKRVTLETRTAKARPKQGGAEAEEDRARAAERGARRVDPQGPGRQRPGARLAPRSGRGLRPGAPRSGARSGCRARRSGTGSSARRSPRRSGSIPRGPAPTWSGSCTGRCPSCPRPRTGARTWTRWPTTRWPGGSRTPA